MPSIGTNVEIFSKFFAKDQFMEENRKIHKESVKKFKKSQKPKRNLKKTLLSWILGVAIFVGAVAGVTLIYKDKTEGKSAYNREIQRKYAQVDKVLTERLREDTRIDAIRNGHLCELKFLEPEESETKLRIIYEGNYDDGEKTKGIAIYNVLENYYNALVEAEETTNVLYYLDALNTIFKEMTLVDEDLYRPIPCDLLGLGIGKSEENSNKFNEIFALDNIEDPNIIRQVGFLPYDIEVVDFHVSEPHKYSYTYRITGLSYCETKTESKDKLSNNENFILSSDYDKNHIKIYQRDILFSSTHTNPGGITLSRRLSGDIWAIIDGRNEPYTIKTILFEDKNLMDLFETLKFSYTKFEKPENFDLKEYQKNQSEMENVK